MAPFDTNTQEPEHPGDGNVTVVDAQDELNQNYLDYSMSVIVSRALPDVRDGLKPVHRRILYAMQEGGYTRNKSHRKSARIVGDVMGQYHPHGDAAIYDAMVKMGQTWRMRLPLVDGQGNFGSPDGDPPAAMRYTEARMAKVAESFLEGIDKNVVDFRENYDETTREPTVLPARFPNLLVNGDKGIAVGMATEIPPHNPREVLDACLTLIDHPETDAAGLMENMPAPDFPTGGIILGRKGASNLYAHGEGSIVVSGVYRIVDAGKKKQTIEITELPYGVNKADFIEKVASLVKSGTLEGIADIQDNSDRHGMCIRVDVKRDADPEVIVTRLRKNTDFETKIAAKMVCLDPRGYPRTMSLREVLDAFLKFRREVIRRRTLHDLQEARKQLHVATGLYAAITRLDDVVHIIRNAQDRESAHARLKTETFQLDDTFRDLLNKVDPASVPDGDTFQLSDRQVKEILEMRLHKLTGLERENIKAEARQLSERVEEALRILNNADVLEGVLRDEIEETKSIIATDRLTRIQEAEADNDIDELDMITRRDVVITRTRYGYIKRTDLDSYRSQRRGGKGKSGMSTREGDVVVSSIVATTHTPFAVFMDNGNVYELRAHRIPDTKPNGRGKPLVNLLPVQSDDRIQDMVALPEDRSQIEDSQDLLFIFENGMVRRNAMRTFVGLTRRGKRAMPANDPNAPRLTNVIPTDESQEVLILTKHGQATRIPVSSIRRVQARESYGVRGIQLESKDRVADALVVNGTDIASSQEAHMYMHGGEVTVTDPETNADETKYLSTERMEEIRQQDHSILTVTANGLGKISSVIEYRKRNRGAKGVRAMRLRKGDELLGALQVDDANEVLLVTNEGTTVRTNLEEFDVMNRLTQGKKLVSLESGQQIVDVAHVDS